MNIAEFYNKLNDKERKVFYIAITALVLAFFDMLFLRPVLSRLADLEEKVASTTIDIKKDIRFISYRDKIMAEKEVFKQYETGEDKIGEQIIAEFLKTIETLAAETSVSLSRVTPAEVDEKKGSLLYFANVDCSGKLEDIIAFMHRINSTHNLLKIVRMNMMGNKASKEQVKGELKISKLVINPSTVGNYEFSAEEKKEVTQEELDEAVTSMGLFSGGQSSSSSGQSGSATSKRQSASGSRSEGAGGAAQGGRTPNSGAGASREGRGSKTSGEAPNGSDGGAGAVGEDINVDLDGASPQRNSNGQPGIESTVQFQESQATDLGGASRNTAQTVQQDKINANGQEAANQTQEAAATQPKNERVKIDGVETLWNNFVAKVTGKEELVPAEEGVYVPGDYQESDQRNLWERKMR